MRCDGVCMATTHTIAPGTAPGQDREAEFFAALAAAQADMTDVAKDRTVDTGSFSYSYADLSSIISVVRRALNRHGLSFSQSTSSERQGDVVAVTVKTTVHGAVEAMKLESEGTTVWTTDGSPQKIGGAITYARRYDLQTLVGIAAEEDTDARGHEDGTTKKPVPTRRHWFQGNAQAMSMMKEIGAAVEAGMKAGFYKEREDIRARELCHKTKSMQDLMSVHLDYIGPDSKGEAELMGRATEGFEEQVVPDDMF
jgi:hypothetical protein